MMLWHRRTHRLRQLAATWRRKSKDSIAEATAIRQTIGMGCDAEDRALARADHDDVRPADLAQRLAPLREKGVRLPVRRAVELAVASPPSGEGACKP